MLCKIIGFQGLWLHKNEFSARVADIVAISVTACPPTDAYVLQGGKKCEGGDPSHLKQHFLGRTDEILLLPLLQRITDLKAEGGNRLPQFRLPEFCLCV